MNPALAAMLARYPMQSTDAIVNALREIIQELTLLGLWRAKFFERAAFYGGTALRVLYGLDRFSEDMGFSLLEPDDSFAFQRYLPQVEKELAAWGFGASIESKRKTSQSQLESAFLKANTEQQLLVIEADENLTAEVHSRQTLKIKIEVDTDPPPEFTTETKFCLQPIPFSVLAYDPPSLFARKMHALMCRHWQNRVKGRDWYDFVWYVGRRVRLDLVHLEQRMRQSGHYTESAPITEKVFHRLLREKIASLDIAQAKADVARFLKAPEVLDLWSKEFFLEVAKKIRT